MKHAMSDLIFYIFKFLTDVPYNFWGWLLLFTAPILVFIARPESSATLKFIRVIVAIGLTYIFFNLALHTGRTLDWKKYEACLQESPYGEMSVKTHELCGHLVDIADGASSLFYVFLGWIPATAYVGIFESIWRFRHRKRIKKMGKSYKGKWFSNIPIGFALFCFVVYPVGALLGGLVILVLYH